jgi:hypothetical protein
MKKITKEAGEMDGLDDTSTDRKNTANTPASYPFGKGAYSKEHLDYTIKKFQPYYKTTLTYDIASEIVFNTLNFYNVISTDNTHKNKEIAVDADK